MARRRALLNKPDQNNTSGMPYSQLRGDELAAFDALPAPLRHALHESVIDWCALWLRGTMRRYRKLYGDADLAVELTLVELRGYNAAEMVDFAHRWPSRFGSYPHVAADATVQPYGRGHKGQIHPER